MKSLIKSAITPIFALSSTVTLTLALTLISISTLHAQDWEKYLPQDKIENGTITLDDYREAFSRYAAYFNADPYGYYTVDGKRQRVNGWMQFKRWEWEMERKVDPETGQFPKTDAWTEWNRYLQANPDASRSAYGDWDEMGPYITPGGYNGMGRINCIAFHPDYSHTFWVGAPTGGIWKTTNYGASWICYGDDIEIMGVSDIIIPDDYQTTNTIYIATGDRDTWSGRSIGVMKSTNGGINWQETDLTYDRWDDHYVNRLLKHPDDDEVIYAATSEGIYKTTDGGNTFNQITTIHVIDMEFKPLDPSTIYGSSKKRFESGPCQFFRSTDNGQNWDTLMAFSDGKRAEIAVSPDEPDWVYALVSIPDGALDGVFRSTDSGDTWELRYDGTVQYQNLLSGACDADGTDGQGMYDLCIAANPVDADMIFVGGINTWRSVDGGLSWVIVNNRKEDCDIGIDIVHADKHNHVFRAGTTELYECHDGGLHRSLDLGNSWTDLSSGLRIGQIYRLSTAQTTNEEILTGYQDVGSKLLSGGIWDEVSGGDGMHNIIDPTNHQIQYSSTQNGGSIYRTTDHWASGTNIRDNIPDTNSGAWVTPFVLDPNNPQILFVGLNDLWKSTDRGDSFAMLYDCPNIQEGLRCIAIAPSNSLTMVIANKSELYKTTNGGVNWQAITTNFPLPLNYGRLPSKIMFKDDDDQTFWVTLGSYDQHGIYETTDGGQTFTNISDGLPHVPVNCVIENTLVTSYTELYCATEAGVFVKFGLQPWLPFNNNMPLVACNWLEIYYNGANSKLRCGTWGRGVWESDLYSYETSLPGIWTGLVSTDWNNLGNWNYRFIPDGNTDVTIPEDCPNYPVVTGATRYCNNLVIEDGASLGIDGVLLNVYGNLDIYGDLELLGTGSSLYIADDIAWFSGSSANIASNSNNIFVGGDWSFKSGTTVGLNAGTVVFQDAGNRFIECESPDSYFHHLQVSKPSGHWVYLPLSNPESLQVMGNLTITANSLLKSLSEKAIIVSGVFVPTGNFQFNQGVFTYKGPNSTWTCTAESYFNGLNMFGPTGEVTLGSNITINANLFGYGGQLAAGSYTINLKGDWYLEGDDFDPGTGKVVFCGDENQYFHDDLVFNVLKLDKPADTLVLETFDITCNQYIWNSGVLKMKSGSFTAGDLSNIDGISGEIHLLDGTIDLTNDDFVHILGDLYIHGGEFIVRGGIGDSFWPFNQDASLHMTSGIMDFKDVGIFISGGSSSTFTEDISGGTIRTSGSFQGTGNFFNPDGGTVELYGISDCYISLAQGSYFRDLIINKGSYRDGPGRAYGLNKQSKSPVTTRSAVDTSASTLSTRPSGGNRSLSAMLSGNFAARNLSIASGSLNLNGHTAQVNNNLIITGTLTMNDPADFLIVGGNVSWLVGSDANVTDGIIEFHQDWFFNSGTHAEFSGNNETRPVGTAAQGIYCHDDDACFDKVVVYNISAPVTIPVSQTRAVRIADDLTLVAGSELIVHDSLIVSDIWMVQDGAIATLDSDATAIIDNQLYLRGSMSVLDGEIKINSIFLSDPTAMLTINGGSFINQAPYSGTYNTFFCTTNLMSGVLEITNNGLSIGTTNPFNMTGGRVRIGWSFKTNGPGVFTPSVGTIEFIGNHNAALECTSGNHLNSIIVFKTAASLTLADDLALNNDLTCNGGTFATAGYNMDIGDDVTLGTGVTLMQLSSSLVTVGGEWTNNKGPSALDEGTSLVTFTGSGPITFSTSETFYDVYLNRSLASGQFITLSGGKTLGATNNFLIESGALLLNNNCTLDVNNFYLLGGAGLIAAPDQPNITIEVAGTWSNANNGFTNNTGFNYGISSVVFDGSANQNMSSSGGEEFYDLVIDKSTGAFKPLSAATVMHECTVADGSWDIGVEGLNHYFLDDLVIESPADWLDSTCNLYFIGTGEQWIRNLTTDPVVIDELVLDQPGGASASSLNLEGELRCKNWVSVVSGELNIQGDTLDVGVRLMVLDDGMVMGGPASAIRMDNGSTILLNEGGLDMNGTLGSPARITNRGSGHYTFSVVNQGHFAAIHTIVEYMDQNGVHFYNNGLADTTDGFYKCTFQNGAASGTLLKFETPQIVGLSHITFPANTWGGAYNVTKLTDNGNVTIDIPSGNFAGPAYENDPNNRIHWPNIGRWTGAVSNDWHSAGNWYFDILPDEYIDVYIPDSMPNNPRIDNINADCRSLVVEPDALIQLYNHNLNIQSYADIWGEFRMRGGEYLYVDSLNWKPGSTAIMGNGSTIRIFGDMIFENGSNIALTNGIIEFRGIGISHIKCLAGASQIHHLTNMKDPAGALHFDVASTGDLVINGNLLNSSGATLVGNSPNEVSINGYLDNAGGHIRMAVTDVVFSGDPSSVPLTMTAGDFFNDLTIATSAPLYLDNTYCDTLWVKGNLIFEQGASGTSSMNANGVYILLYGHWHNNAGPDAFVHYDNTVEIKNGSAMREITGSNLFYDLFDNTLSNGYLRLLGPTEIEHDLTVGHYVRVYNDVLIYNSLDLNDAGAELNLYGSLSNVETNIFDQGGTLSGSGGNFLAWDLLEPLIYGDYNLEGTMQVSLHQDVSSSIDLGADISITQQATLTIYGGSGNSNWPGLLKSASLTMSDLAVLTVQDRGINILVANPPMESFTANITGGTIRTQGNFSCTGANTTFLPTGGKVEIFGTTNTRVTMAGSNKSFYDLMINKGNSVVNVLNEINIQHHLDIHRGTLNTQGNPVNVGP